MTRRSFAVVFALVSAGASPTTAQIYVPNANADTVTVYDPAVGGNQAPLQTISSTPLLMDLPTAVALDLGRDELFVTSRSSDSVFVFDRGATGATMPLRRLVGAATGLADPWEVAVDYERGELYVFSRDAGAIQVFPVDADGDVAPTRVIEGSPAWGPNSLAFVLDLVHDELVVADRTPGAVALRFYPLDADGPTVALRSITGPATGLADAFGLAVDPLHDEVWVTQSFSVRAFARTATGNAAPLRVLAGGNTGIAQLKGVAVDPLRNEIAVTQDPPDAHAVRIFARTATGDVAPLRTITGAATALNGPVFLESAPRLIFADGFYRGDTSAWSATAPGRAPRAPSLH